MGGLFKDADPGNVVDPLYIFTDPPKEEVKPKPVEAPHAIPEVGGRKSRVQSRKSAVRKSKQRQGRRSTILSEDDKMGGK